MNTPGDSAESILDEMMLSCRRRRWRERSRQSVLDILDEIDPKSFHRARHTGWLKDKDFLFVLEQCEEDRQGEFKTRWYAFKISSASLKADVRNRRIADRVGFSDLLRLTHGDASFWGRLAGVLFENVSAPPWPTPPEAIAAPLDKLVEDGREKWSEERALKNALILVRAGLHRCRSENTAERLMLCSLLSAACRCAGLLGHRASLRFVQNVLTKLHHQFPDDLHVERLACDARAIAISHGTKVTPKVLRCALAFHAWEDKLAEHCIMDRDFAADWPILYREVRNSVWRLVEVRLDAGVGVSLKGRLFQRHLEWQGVTEARMPKEFRRAIPRLDVETIVTEARLRAGICLDRANKNRSLEGGDYERALDEIDQALYSPELQGRINLHSRGHLLGLRAEALLGLYAQKRTPTRKDEYIACRKSAVDAYEAVRDEANFENWARRLSVLEKVIDASPIPDML